MRHEPEPGSRPRPSTWAFGRRAAGPALLAALASFTLLGPAPAQATAPRTNGGGTLLETRYDAVLHPHSVHTRVEVTRTFHNAGATSELLELEIPLPCDAQLGDFQLLDGDGQWVAAELLEAEVAQERWFAGADVSGEPARDADTSAWLTRDDCDAQLLLHPVPAFGERSIHYTLTFMPAREDGEYRLTLPAFHRYDQPARVLVESPEEPGMQLRVDDREPSLEALTQPVAPLVLDGAHEHTLSLRSDRPKLARARHSIVDFGALGVEGERVLVDARLDLPARLPAPPPPRRVVLLLDGSRSLDETSRDALLGHAAAYLRVLAQEHPDARVELVRFDRELSRLYHDFIPAAWAAEDIRGWSSWEARNGSELGLALDGARHLLDRARTEERARLDEDAPDDPRTDWILAFSDFDLRSTWADDELDAQLAATLDAAAHDVRVHAVRPHSGTASFRPYGGHDTWSRFAPLSGGASWEVSHRAHDPEQLESAAREWIRPTRVWNMKLVQAFGDAGEVSYFLGDSVPEGTRVSDTTVLGAEDLEDGWGRVPTHIAFTGEVWGQPRAWTTSSDRALTQVLAGHHALGQSDASLEQAERLALARLAAVVTAELSAFASASFGGPTQQPLYMRGFGSRSIGYTTRCGGPGRAHVVHRDDLGLLIASATAHCTQVSERALASTVVELDKREVTEVASPDACIEQALWGVDLRVSNTIDSGRFALGGSAGAVELRRL